MAARRGAPLDAAGTQRLFVSASSGRLLGEPGPSRANQTHHAPHHASWMFSMSASPSHRRPGGRCPAAPARIRSHAMTFHAVVFVAATLLANAGPAPAPAGVAPAGVAPADSVPLYTDLGTHHSASPPASRLAQQYFDQGLRLAYGFNHAEAIRSFARSAASSIPTAPCATGASRSPTGRNVNAPMDSAGGVAAYGRRRPGASPSRPRPRRGSRRTSRRCAQRYAAAPPPTARRSTRAYRRAMAEVARQLPGRPRRRDARMPSR